MGCKTWKKEAVDYSATIFLSFCGVFCSKMLKREYLIIYHNYYNLPVAGPCLQTPNWGLKTRQQISSSSWLQEVSRSQAVPGSGQPTAPSCFLRHQPHSPASAASGFSTFCQQSKARKQCVQAVYRRPGPGSLWGNQIMAVRDVYASKKKGTRIYVTEAMRLVAEAI